MKKSRKWILLMDSSLLPLIPLLFLYNRNSQHLLLKHILVLGTMLAVVCALFHLILRFIFKSDVFAFFGNVMMVVLLFAHNSIYNRFMVFTYQRTMMLLITPLLSYVFAYITYKLFKKIESGKFSIAASVFVFTMLVMNIGPFIYGYESGDMGEMEYKSEFFIDEGLESPNVYFLLCDGMVGFEVMEKYFAESQDEFKGELEMRGFEINKEASLESGHQTRIAIPAMMSPDFNDNYLKRYLSDHESAMVLRYQPDTLLYLARINNETIRAFDEKGYETVAMSVDDKFFLPNTDYYYYIEAYYRDRTNRVTSAELVKKSKDESKEFDADRVYAHQLGEIFLGGIPEEVYDRFFSHDEIEEMDLSTSFDGVDEVLLGSQYAKVNTAMVEGLYDSLNSNGIGEPKFVIIHNLMPHGPFNLDENGGSVKSENRGDINYYPGHHEYSAKVLVNMIDMIIKSDPDAVIIVQGDHGLHMQNSEKIKNAFGEDVSVEIWNSVISAIRVPEKYRNGEEHHAMEDPRNIFRYLVNNFVGHNYEYIE